MIKTGLLRNETGQPFVSCFRIQDTVGISGVYGVVFVPSHSFFLPVNEIRSFRPAAHVIESEPQAS